MSCKPYYKDKKTGELVEYASVDAVMKAIEKDHNNNLKELQKTEDEIAKIKKKLEDTVLENEEIEAANELLDVEEEQPEEETEQPTLESNNLQPAFTGKVTQEMFTEDMVMVFGANKSGFHGQGMAALAYANTVDNYRNWNPNLSTDVKNNKK